MQGRGQAVIRDIETVDEVIAVGARPQAGVVRVEDRIEGVPVVVQRDRLAIAPEESRTHVHVHLEAGDILEAGPHVRGTRRSAPSMRMPPLAMWHRRRLLAMYLPCWRRPRAGRRRSTDLAVVMAEM